MEGVPVAAGTMNEKTPLGTRTELLESIVSALELTVMNPLFAGIGIPINLECNRPTLLEHCNQWSLCGKQKKAFILCCSALLQCIFRQNIYEGASVENEQVVRIGGNVETRLIQILPADGQLIMFVSGSGGTDKSRVIQSVVDCA